MDLVDRNLWLKHWEERNDVVFDYDGEAEILASEFKKAQVKSILSLGCGTAPFLRQLAPMGFEGTGIDKNQSVIDIGQDLARKGNSNIRFIKTDIREMPHLGKFDAAFAMHLTFPKTDWDKILKRLKSSLNQTGIFIAGFVYSENTPKIGLHGVYADLLSLTSGKTIVEVDRYLIENSHYKCSMILIEETPDRVYCDRRVSNIEFFYPKESIIDLLTMHGYTNPKELREDDIGFPGLRAVLLRTISE